MWVGCAALALAGPAEVTGTRAGVSLSALAAGSSALAPRPLLRSLCSRRLRGGTGLGSGGAAAPACAHPPTPPTPPPTRHPTPREVGLGSAWSRECGRNQRQRPRELRPFPASPGVTGGSHLAQGWREEGARVGLAAPARTSWWPPSLPWVSGRDPKVPSPKSWGCRCFPVPLDTPWLSQSWEKGRGELCKTPPLSPQNPSRVQGTEAPRLLQPRRRLFPRFNEE